ncbi:kelch-like protein 24 [Folsomia candida]|uniref:kelch-like protein 24 n=1 Tax=Folsomia candida TaxID=158441 RepID=UPI001604B366|nr:kelch-like protein 24 [Folsomia candida]
MDEKSSKSEGETNGDSSVEGLPRRKWEWTGSHDHRLLNLLETGYKSDLILDLRPEGLRLPVHKIFLEAGSPVLDGKIKPETEEIKIENVDTRVFKMLLKYLYTGKSGFGMGDALQLMQLSTEYEVNGLRDECAEILKGDLTLENVLSLFQSGMEYAHGDFIQSTLKFICKNARKLLKSEEIGKLRLECLVEIIQQDSLKVINEMEVFEAVNRWGTAECVRQNLDPQNTENLRKCLAKPLRHIRFSLMDPAEFALNVTTKKLLSMEESVELLNCFLIPPVRRNMLPPGTFMSTPRTYIDKDIVLTRTLPEGTRVIQTIAIDGNPNGRETIAILVKEDVTLKSISIPKEFFDVNPANLYYYDLIKCNLQFANDRASANQLVTQFDTYERGDVYLRISLNPPCEINVANGWLRVTITFSGDVGYHGLSETVANKQNMNVQDLFPANGHTRVITNYTDLFKDPAVGKNTAGIVIKRCKGDQLGVNHGFIEKLEFEVV